MMQVKKTEFTWQDWRKKAIAAEEKEKKAYLLAHPTGKMAEIQRVREKKALDQRRIRILTTENPKKLGSESRKRFELYKNGMTIQMFLKSGGKRIDIAWDVRKGFVELEDQGELR